MKPRTFQTVINNEFDFDRATPMHNSDGIGYTVIKVENMQIDRVYFGPGLGVDTHTHDEIDHVLQVIKGTGLLVREEIETELKPGVLYDVLKGVRHAIFAGTEDEFGLDLQVTSNGLMPVNSPKRLTGGGSFKNTK